MSGKRRRRLSPRTVQARADAYFAACDETRVEYTTKSGIPKARQAPYTLIGLANALGITREELKACLDGTETEVSEKEGGRDERQKIRSILKNARGRMEQQVLELAAMGDLDTKIAQIIMGDWGYPARQVSEAANPTIAWEGVEKEDAEAFSQ